MTKRIVSGIFILTALGALGVILAGALTSGEQLIVRFLTAVIVAALGLYVISDLRLQADDDAMTARSAGHPRMATVDAPPNSTAAFMATVTRRSEQKAGEAIDDAGGHAGGRDPDRLVGGVESGPLSTSASDPDNAFGQNNPFAMANPKAPETIRADTLKPPSEISISDLFANNGASSVVGALSSADKAPADESACEEHDGEERTTDQFDDDTSIAAAGSNGRSSGFAYAGDARSADPSIDPVDQTAPFELTVEDETGALEKVMFATAGVNGSSLNGSTANGSASGGTFLNAAQLNGSFGGGDSNRPGSDRSGSGSSAADRDRWLSGSVNGSHGTDSGGHDADGDQPSGNDVNGNGSSANGAATNGAAVNGRHLNGASLKSVGPLEADADTVRPVQRANGDDDEADRRDWAAPAIVPAGADTDAVADLGPTGSGRVLEDDERDPQDAAPSSATSGHDYSDELQSSQYDWPAPPPKDTASAPQLHPFEKASADYEAEKARLAVARAGGSLPVVASRRGLEAADYADAPLAPIIDLRSELMNQHSSGVDAAINAGELEVIATLIEQGMLSTQGAISDRDVRTMVYVAFTSNELRKLLLAGGTPDGPNHGLDLGPVELFDERIHAPAPKTIYAGLPPGQPQPQPQRQIG